MISVTERAKERLYEALEENGVEPPHCFKLVENTEGVYGMSIITDEPKETDQVISHEGREVLLLENELAEEMEGRVLDAETTQEGKVKLTLTPG